MKKYFFLVSSFFCISFSESMRADVISLTTSKAVGEKITIAINAGGETTLDWGNGKVVAVKFDGNPTEIEVKSNSLVLTAESPLTYFYAPAAGINTLDVSSATALTQLFCSDNELTELDLSQNKALKTLDVQNNKLTDLRVKYNEALEYINCANNEISRIAYNNDANSPIRLLICSGNKIEKFGSLDKMAALQTLWINDNNINSSIKLDAAANLRTLNVESNAISSIELSGNKSQLTDFWAADNELRSLDLSSGTAALNNFSVANNDLTEIKWDADFDNKMDYVNLINNQLYFNSFPPVGNNTISVLTPQEPFKFLAEGVNVNEGVEAEYLFDSYSGAGDSRRRFKLYDSQGNEMVKSKTGDYNYTSSGVFTFYKPVNQAYLVATTNVYKDVTLTSQPFNVIDPTGIDDILGDDVNKSGSVYDAQGRLVLVGNAQDRSLSSGIYIIDGKKYLVK